MAVEVDIPGRGFIRLEEVVMDFNGTLAVDGVLVEGVEGLLRALKARVGLKVVTADTFGTVRRVVGELAEVVIISPGQEARDKLEVLRALGPERTMAVGNGANDELMLREAAVGVVVVGREGASPRAIAAADIVVPGPLEALGLVVNPGRLKATLRC